MQYTKQNPQQSIRSRSAISQGIFIACTYAKITLRAAKFTFVSIIFMLLFLSGLIILAKMNFDDNDYKQNVDFDPSNTDQYSFDGQLIFNQINNKYDPSLFPRSVVLNDNKTDSVTVFIENQDVIIDFQQKIQKPFFSSCNYRNHVEHINLVEKSDPYSNSVASFVEIKDGNVSGIKTSVALGKVNENLSPFYPDVFLFSINTTDLFSGMKWDNYGNSPINTLWLQVYFKAITASLDILHKKEIIPFNPPQSDLIFFPNKQKSLLSQQIEDMLIILVLLLPVTLLTTSFTLYDILLQEKIISFLNIVGFPYLIQFISLYTNIFLLAIMPMLFSASCISILVTLNGSLFSGIFVPLLLNLYGFHFVFCLAVTVKKALKKIEGKLTVIDSIVTLVIFQAPSYLLPEPNDSSILYKYIFYSYPSQFQKYVVGLCKATTYLKLGWMQFWVFQYKDICLLKLMPGTILVIFFISILGFKSFSTEKNLIGKIGKNIFNLLGWLYKKILGLNKRSIRVQKVGNEINKQESVASPSTQNLVIRGLSKEYRGLGSNFKALTDVSLSIEKGEKVALLGHNGAGKTTFLSTIIGLVQKSSGTVWLENKRVEKTQDIAGKLGFCPQYTSTISYFTVLENLKLIANCYNMRENKIDYILDQLDLTSSKNKKAVELSGGQRRKLAFAIAILSSCPLIILDEPSTGVDILARKKMFSLLKQFSQNSIVIFSTHLVEEAEEFSDKVAILSSGKLMDFDTATNIKRKYNIIYNRLTINFNITEIGKAKKRILEFLQDYPQIKVLKETKEMLYIEIGQVRYTKLAELYEFLLDGKTSLGISSFGLAKSGLEDVLGSKHFREDKTETTTELKGGIVPIRTSKNEKRISSISILRALLYNFSRSALLDYKNLIGLIALSCFSFYVFFRGGIDTAENFQEISFKLVDYKFGPTRPFRIIFYNPNETMKRFIEFMQGNKSIKVEELSEEKIKELSINKIEDTQEGTTKEKILKIMNGLDSEILAIDQPVLSELDTLLDFELLSNWEPNEISKLTDNSTGIFSPKSRNSDLMVFGNIWAQYLVESSTGNKNLELQSLIVNQTAYNKTLLILNQAVFNGYIFIILIQIILLNRYVKERCSGIYTVWYVNGIPKISLFFFNLISNSLMIIFAILIPIPIGILLGQDNLSMLRISEFIFNINIISVIFTLIFSFLAEFLSGIKLGTICYIIVFYTFIGKLVGDTCLQLDIFKVGNLARSNPFFKIIGFFELVKVSEFYLVLKKNLYTATKMFERLIFTVDWAYFWYTFDFYIPMFLIMFFSLLLLNFGSLSGILEKTVEWFKRTQEENISPIKQKFSDEEILTTHSLNKRYGLGLCGKKVYALKDFNFNAYRGDHIGILGSNGGGKSTTFKLLVKETLPTSGVIFVSGKNLNTCKPGYMGYVPQYEVLIPEMTPFQTLKFYSLLYGQGTGSNVTQEINETLRVAKLLHNKNKKISQLSGGNKRKVLLAVNLFMGKKLIVFDEPTTGIDLSSCQDIWETIKYENANKTSLLASHSVAEIELLCDKIIVLVKGKIVAAGTKEKLKEEKGKYYEVEIEIKKIGEKDNDLGDNMVRIKDWICEKFGAVEFVDKNSYKFCAFIDKTQSRLPELIRIFGENSETLGIDQYFVNESSLESVLSGYLSEPTEKEKEEVRTD